MATEAWSADDGKIWLSGTYFSSVTGSDFTASVKEISVGGGDRDVDQVRCFGSGTNNFMYRKGMTMKEGTIKFHFKDNDLWLGIAGGSYISGYPQQWTGDGLRYPITITYELIDRLDVSGLHFKAEFDRAMITSHNWTMPVDGTGEGEITFKCLPHRFTSKYTNNRVVSPLT